MMYHKILMQKEQPEYQPLKKVVKLLLEFAVLDSIYFSKPAEEPKKGILTVIVSDNNRHYYDEVAHHLWKLIKNHTEFSFCFFNRDYVKEEIKNGNLFFVLHCRESGLVYSKAKHKPVVNISKIKLKKLLKRTSERFERRTIECNAISRNLQHHRRCGNHVMALYVIYQQFRYLFINVSWLVTGEWITNDSIKEHQEHISRFSNVPGKVFDISEEKDFMIVKWLDLACRAVQCGEETEPLNADMVLAASVKLEEMQKEVTAIFEQYTEKTRLIFKELVNS